MAAAGSGSDGGQGGGDDRRRIPKNIQQLLKICAENADPENSEKGLEPLSEERRQWLSNALDDLTVSPVQRLKECIAVVAGAEEDENGVDKKIQALEELVEWCEHIDFAVDFHKIGGFEMFSVALNHEEPEVRWQTLDLVGTLVQNNPYCQEAVVQSNLVPKMLLMLDTDGDSTVRTKALFAISCLTRDCDSAQKVFLENDGFSVVMRAMQADVEKLKIKAAFMITAMCGDKPEFKDILCDMGMVDQLVGHLGEEHASFHEHIMSALLSLVRDHNRTVQECQRPELGLVSLLKQRKEELKGKEEFQEECEYADELLKLLTDGQTEYEEATR